MPVRVPDLKRMKRGGKRIAMLTSYDFTMARLLDRAGVDVLLVGDSLGMVMMGHENTLQVTMDVMVHHTAAVARGTERALVVADMPFLSCHTGLCDAVFNAGRLLQEGGAQAVKVEGGHTVLEAVQRIVEAGIPVMGHLGLTPQSIHQIGGFRMQAKGQRQADELLQTACWAVGGGSGEGAAPPLTAGAWQQADRHGKRGGASRAILGMTRVFPWLSLARSTGSSCPFL